ncbi:MAG: hypothetical protein KFW21_01945 [Spirochaetota bacterium]|nr:hypothetical protein [Spirochaetota bacterium]
MDYRRLPEHWDVFRCNRFMLEDKYYLGKKVDYLMIGGGKRYDTFLLAKAYETYGFYQLNKVYCTGLIGNNIISKLYTKYYIEVDDSSKEELSEFITKYRKEHFGDRDIWYNSGTGALINAVYCGYNEIYLTGIEFQSTDKWIYAYEDPQNPMNQIEFDFYHDLNFDKAIIKFINSLSGINLYSIIENSVLSTMIPLAPLQNNNPYIPIKNLVCQKIQNKIDKDAFRNIKILDDYLKLNEQNINIYIFLLYTLYKNIIGIIIYPLKKLKYIPVLNKVYYIIRKIYRKILDKR